MLVKALYGLKQSLKKWQFKLKTLLNELGFKPLNSDSTIFYNPDNSIFIMTFVDDYLFIGPNISKINVVKRKIVKEYVIKRPRPRYLFSWGPDHTGQNEKAAVTILKPLYKRSFKTFQV